MSSLLLAVGNFGLENETQYSQMIQRINECSTRETSKNKVYKDWSRDADKYSVKDGVTLVTKDSGKIILSRERWIQTIDDIIRQEMLESNQKGVIVSALKKKYVVGGRFKNAPSTEWISAQISDRLDSTTQSCNSLDLESCMPKGPVDQVMFTGSQEEIECPGLLG
jgi:hypothetical protein